MGLGDETKFLAIFFLVVVANFSVMSGERQSPTAVVSSFLDNMKEKDYTGAANYLAESELNWLANKIRPLFREKIFTKMVK